MKLSVAIIAKNEEAMIRNCLESVKDADEIVFVDTGSTDSTIVMAEQYTSTIFLETWKDDFSKMRNLASSLCEGDWILSIDADEQLEDGGTVKIKDFLSLYAPGIHAYRLQLEYSDKTSMGIKLLRNRAGIYWVGKAHNDLNIEVKEVLPVKIYCADSPAHKNDPDRSLRILKQDFYDTPSNKRNLYYLAREYAIRHNFEDAINLFGQYLEEGEDIFLRADSCLYLAKLYKANDNMQLALTWADTAAHMLPGFKEAWDFCAHVAQDKLEKLAYLKSYDKANNNEVRIIRKVKWSENNVWLPKL